MPLGSQSVPSFARILVLVVFVAACSAPAAPRSTTDRDTASFAPDRGAFTLGPNDLVHVSVFGQPDFTPPATGVRVAPDGTLSLPLLGAVPVEGLSAEEARRTIEAGLERYLKAPSVSVSVLEHASRRFFLFGEVQEPGPYPMDGPLTALEALSFGGGFASGAKRDRVALIRPHGEGELEVLTFNARTPGPDGLVQVLPGDFLFVSQSGAGRFSADVLPYLQGFGFTLSQLSALALAYDRLYND